MYDKLLVFSQNKQFEMQFFADGTHFWSGNKMYSKV